MHTSSIDPIVAENVRAALKRRDRSAYSIAVAIDRAPNWLYRVINQKSGILLPTLRELASELGVSAGSLVDPNTLQTECDDAQGVMDDDHTTVSGLGERLAKARKRAGMLQADLAAAMGPRYDRPMIVHIEAGRKHPRLEGLARAAQALGISTDYLLGLTGEDPGSDPTPCPGDGPGVQ